MYGTCWNLYQIRRQLLATASAVAVLMAYEVSPAAAADGDRPPIWIDFGFHYDRLSGTGEPFAPPFVANAPWSASKLVSPLVVQQKLTTYSYGGDGSISFRPDGSDWNFSVSVRYGRSHAGKNLHEQHALPVYTATAWGRTSQITPTVANFEDISVHEKEAHAILDFHVGRDVSLGGSTTSEFNFGIRVAHLNAHKDSTIYARPDIEVRPFAFPPYLYNVPFKYFHNYAAKAHADRSFNGVGPSISWTGSTPLAGTANDGELTFDWGANAAVLFGRQKAKVHHQTNGYYLDNKYEIFHWSHQYITQYQHTADHRRNRSVAVPDVGGFAGLGFRYQGAKISLGYRADFFFGAIDGGWDARNQTTTRYNGPYASISIGFGD